MIQYGRDLSLTLTSVAFASLVIFSIDNGIHYLINASFRMYKDLVLIKIINFLCLSYRFLRPYNFLPVRMSVNGDAADVAMGLDPLQDLQVSIEAFNLQPEDLLLAHLYNKISSMSVAHDSIALCYLLANSSYECARNHLY